MKLIEDFDTFEPKASKIINSGLSPLCDHAGFTEGHFCCLECLSPIFDIDDMCEEAGLYYTFRRPLSLELFNYEKNFSEIFPKISLACKKCGSSIGFILGAAQLNERQYCVFAKSVFLDKKTIVDLG